jgi:hypothetical protein
MFYPITPPVQTSSFYSRPLISVIQSGETINEAYILSKAKEYQNNDLIKYDLKNNTIFIYQDMNISFRNCIEDAIRRHCAIYHVSEYNITQAESFLISLKALRLILPRISFYPDGAKARFVFNKKEFVVDFDYEEPEPVYVSAYKGKVLVFKKCVLAELQETLENF